MAEQLKLNNIAKAKNQHQLDMEALQRGAATTIPVNTPPAQVPQPVPAGSHPLGEMQDIEDTIANNQAANLNNPGVQDRLNTVAKARAKFYGEGTPAAPLSPPTPAKNPVPESYPAMEPKGRR